MNFEHKNKNFDQKNCPIKDMIKLSPGKVMKCDMILELCNYQLRNDGRKKWLF